MARKPLMHSYIYFETLEVGTDKITALRRDRVREAVGRLDPDQLADLDRALLIVLGLAR
jgi:mRNA interferase MazF